MSNKHENQQEQFDFIVPQLLIPFSFVNSEKASLNVIPTQIDSGVYRLRSSIEIHIDSGRTVLFHTGIKLDMPQFIDMSPCHGIKPGTSTTVFPRVSIVAQVSSIFDLLVSKGLEVLGPKMLTSNMITEKELVVYIRNINKEMCVIHPGDEIAELTFSVSPLTTLRLR